MSALTLYVAAVPGGWRATAACQCGKTTRLARFTGMAASPPTRERVLAEAVAAHAREYPHCCAAEAPPQIVDSSRRTDGPQ